MRLYKGRGIDHREGVEATVMSQNCSCSNVRPNSPEKDTHHMPLFPKRDLQSLKTH